MKIKKSKIFEVTVSDVKEKIKPSSINGSYKGTGYTKYQISFDNGYYAELPTDEQKKVNVRVGEKLVLYSHTRQKYLKRGVYSFVVCFCIAIALAILIYLCDIMIFLQIGIGGISFVLLIFLLLPLVLFNTVKSNIKMFIYLRRI